MIRIGVIDTKDEGPLDAVGDDARLELAAGLHAPMAAWIEDRGDLERQGRRSFHFKGEEC